MRRVFSLLVLGTILVSCGSKDLQSELQKLELERDELNAKISELQKEIAENNGDSENTKVAYVQVKNIVSSVFKHFIKVQGTIESDNNIFIPPQSPGIVKRIYVEKGDRVKKGQLLAELDGAIYESTIAELETGLELARTVFERQERLWNKKIGSEIQYLQAKTNKEGLDQKLKTVNEQYKLTKITSPISGTVDQVLIKEGEAAAAGFGAIRVVQLSDLKIKAALSENYISNVKTGDLVSVNIPALDKNLNLKIDAVSQVIDPKNRTFNIEISIPKNEQFIKPNMLAVLTINDYTNSDAIVIPGDVLQRTGSEIFCFVAKEHPDASGEKWIVEKRNVATGKYSKEKVEIVEGLIKNENIVTFGFQDLADGQTVQVGDN